MAPVFGVDTGIISVSLSTSELRIVFPRRIPLVHENYVFHFDPSEVCYERILGHTLGAYLRGTP